MSMLTNSIRPASKLASPDKIKELTEIPTSGLPYITGRPRRVCAKCGVISPLVSKTSHPILTHMCAGCKEVFNKNKQLRADKNKLLSDKKELDSKAKA